MWRIAWLLTLLVALLVSACDALEPGIVIAEQNDAPAQQATSTPRSSRTPRATATATRRATRTPRVTATRRITRTPTATPDPRIWAGLTNKRDSGVPLPKEARTFGGGIYVPMANGSDDDPQTVNFSDEILLGVGAYYPNAYQGSTPVLLPDGEGIERVEFYLYGPDGTTVYQRFMEADERPFCFAEDRNQRCLPFNFEENSCQWLPSDGIEPSPIIEGFHQLQVSLFAEDGNAETWFVSVIVTISPTSPCATPREIVHDHFDVSGCCNGRGQRNDGILSAEVQLTTTGYLGAEILLSADACSDVAFRLYVDDRFVAKSEFVGPFGEGWDGSGYMTAFVPLGEYAPGTYTLRVSPEGRIGGCNSGVLGAWEGMVNGYYSQPISE